MNKRQAKRKAADTVWHLIDSYFATAEDWLALPEGDRGRYIEALEGIQREMARRGSPSAMAETPTP